MADTLLISLWNEPTRVNYAGSKAKADVRDILKQMGATVYNLSGQDNISITTELRQIAYRIRSLPQHAILALQYPMRPAFAIPKSGQVKAHDVFKWIEPVLDAAYGTILIVHDLKSLQALIYDSAPSAGYIFEIRALENLLFTRSDAIIVHSPAMALEVTQTFGVSVTKIVPLFMFDYLCPTDLSAYQSISSPSCQETSIVIAGHLDRRNLMDVIHRGLPKRKGLKYDLYGSLGNTSLKRINRSDTTYHGSVAADELPLILCEKAHYGLVWSQLDQDELLYLRMIAPHKLSLYVSSGLIVIAPSGTYAGDLVKELGIGYTLRSLDEILGLLEETSRNPSKVRQMMIRTKHLQRKVNSGSHTKEAIRRALDKLQ